MELLIMLAAGAMNIMCFIIGAKVGQTVSKDKEIEMPTVNPMKAHREHQARKKAEEEQNRYDTILRNIEAYDGTAEGQEDVPR